MSDQTAGNTRPIIKSPFAYLPAASWWFERLPLITLPISVAFIQGYAIRFWTALLGNPGWAVSVGLELLHLWFWFQAGATTGVKRIGWGLLALTATGLLLASAIHEVANPLLRDTAIRSDRVQQRQLLEAEAEVLRKNLTAYREMAVGQGRRGWQDDIRRDTSRLGEITTRLNVLSNTVRADQRSSGRMILPWLSSVMIWVVVAVAVLFQIGVILSVLSVSGISWQLRNAISDVSGSTRQTEKITDSISEEKVQTGPFRSNGQPSEAGFYQDLWRQIEEFALNNKEVLSNGTGKVPKSAISSLLGVNAPDLSAIKLLGQGKAVERKPARASVEKLCKRFGMQAPK